MKRKLWLLTVIVASVLMGSCEDPIVTFNAPDMVGKWVRGTEFYRYDSNHSGVTWDTADDVSEQEGQPFTWTLDGDQLTLVHQMEMGGVVPKVYTVTVLSSSTLTYRDNYNQTFTYSRVR